MRSGEGDLYGFLSVGFAGGLFSFFKGFRVFREYRVLEDTPLIPLRSVAMGLVHVHGRATANEYVTSPVTRTRCCFYKVDIEKWKTEQRGGRWEHYRTDLDEVRFYLDDKSGRVLVDARDAELDLVEAGKREVGRPGAALSRVLSSKDDLALISGSMPTDDDLLSYVSTAGAARLGSLVARGLNAAGHQSDEHHKQARLKAVELFQNLSKPGSAAKSIGGPGGLAEQALLAAGPRPDPKQEQARLAMLEAFEHPAGSLEFAGNMERAAETHSYDPQQVQKFVSGIEGLQHSLEAGWGLSQASGRYRFTEYCILPDHWYDVTGTCAENPNPNSDADRNLIVKGKAEPTFLISWRPAQGIEKHLRRKAALMVLGGAAVAVACLGGLLAKLGLL